MRVDSKTAHLAKYLLYSAHLDAHSNDQKLTRSNNRQNYLLLLQQKNRALLKSSSAALPHGVRKFAASAKPRLKASDLRLSKYRRQRGLPHPGKLGVRRMTSSESNGFRKRSAIDKNRNVASGQQRSRKAKLSTKPKKTAKERST